MTRMQANKTRWEIRQGDSLAMLREMSSETAQAVFCDPPYSSGGAYRADRMQSTGAKYVRSDAGEAHRFTLQDFAGDNRDQRGFLAWASLWLAECWRIAEDGAPIVVCSDWRQLPIMTDALQAGGWLWRGIAVWDKTEAARPEKGRPRAQAEYLLWGSKGPMRPYSEEAPCLPGVITHYLPGSKKQHQADKPVALWRTMLGMVKPGGLVLDPFSGSGSLGVACVLEGLDYLGCEISGFWAEYAKDRIRAEAEQGQSVEAMRAGQTSLLEGGHDVV